MNEHARHGAPAWPSHRAFHETLRVQIARTREAITRCQRLRSEGYCAERDWCDEIASVGEREFDRFDARAAHAMLIERASDRLIGTCRLILPVGRGEFPDLPIEELTGWPPYFCEEPLPIDRVGEISRLAWIAESLKAKRANLYRFIFEEAVPDEDSLPGGERKLVS